MSYLFVVFFSAVLLVVTGVAIAIRYATTRRARLDAAAYPGLARVSRWTLIPRYVGVVLGLSVLPVTAAFGHFGLGIVLMPAVLGCTIEICLIVGEAICFRAAHQPGVAGLERRRLGRYLPAPLVGFAAVVFVVFVVLAVWGWRLAAPDGRSFALTASLGGTKICGVDGTPFFGPYYSVPIGVALLVAIGLGAAALIAIVRRPQGGDPVLAAWDDSLRRRSARAVTATLLGALGGSLVIAASGLLAQQRNAVGFIHNDNGNCGYSTIWGFGYISFQPNVDHFTSQVTTGLLVLCVVVGVVLALAAAVLVLADFAPSPPNPTATPASPVWAAQATPQPPHAAPRTSASGEVAS